MGILGEAAEAPIRAALEIALPDRCTIKRVSQPVSGGAWTDTPTTFATDIPCRVDRDQTLERELIIAGRMASQTSVTISLSTVASRWPGGVVDVRASDQLIVAGDGAGTYEPVAGGGPTTDQYIREVRCLKTE